MQKVLVGMMLTIASSLPALSNSPDIADPLWKADPIVVGHNIACSMSFNEHKRGTAKFSRRVTIIAGTSLQLIFSDMERGTHNLPGSTLTLALDNQEYSVMMLGQSHRDLFAAGIIAQVENVENFLHDFARARRGLIQSRNGLWLLNMRNSAEAAKNFRECVARYAVMAMG